MKTALMPLEWLQLHCLFLLLLFFFPSSLPQGFGLPSVPGACEAAKRSGRSSEVSWAGSHDLLDFLVSQVIHLTEGDTSRDSYILEKNQQLTNQPTKQPTNHPSFREPPHHIPKLGLAPPSLPPVEEQVQRGWNTRESLSWPRKKRPDPKREWWVMKRELGCMRCMRCTIRSLMFKKK